jgi:hypothetical protein
MSVEGHDHAAGIGCPRCVAHLSDHCAVAEVHTVVSTDGGHGALVTEYVYHRISVDSGDHLHA